MMASYPSLRIAITPAPPAHFKSHIECFLKFLYFITNLIYPSFDSQFPIILTQFSHYYLFPPYIFLFVVKAGGWFGRLLVKLIFVILVCLPLSYVQKEKRMASICAVITFFAGYSENICQFKYISSAVRYADDIPRRIQEFFRS